MSKKTITQALRDLYIANGGSAAALEGNSTISDFIDSVSDIIGGGGSAASIIDDSTASGSKTYSSNKIESLIPANELPDVSSVADGAVLASVNGEWTLCNISAVANTETGAVTITFTPVT